MTVRRRLATVAAVLLAWLILPATASAHAVAGETYGFPLPIWLYATAGGLAVVLSVPFAVLGAERTSWVSRRSATPGPWAGVAAKCACWFLGGLYAVAILAGFFGPVEFYGNAATVLFWIDVWVGVAILSALLGNVWDFISPLNAAGRALDQLLARRGVVPSPYPARLGAWPAVAQLIVFGWLELCWSGGSNSQYMALVLLVYVAMHLLAMAVVGAEVWLANGELLTVLARTLSRFAPVEFWAATDEPCQAARCDPAAIERIGCPSCYIDAGPHCRGVRLRAYGAGVHREPPLAAGGGALVLSMLAIVVFDGFSRTNRWYDLTGWIYDRWNWLGSHPSTLRLIAMLIICGGFIAIFIAVMATVAQLERTSVTHAATRYAPSLIPIVAAYFVAHYVAYFVVYSQLTPAVVLDPFEREWIPDYAIWTHVPGALVWYTQVFLIVAGHVMAVFEAQRIARGTEVRRRAATLRHAPLTLLMVVYTMTGLWVLAQAIQAGT